MGEWDIPRVPLRYERAVIAFTALTHQMRAARGAGRARYYEGVTAHQQAAMPEQLLPLFDTASDIEEPEAGGEPVDYMERLRALQDLTPEYMERLEQLAGAVRLRAVLYAAPAVPAPVRGRRTRQYPGGRPNPPRVVRPHRSHRR